MSTPTPNVIAKAAEAKREAEERRNRPSPVRKDFDAAARRIRGEAKAFGQKPAPMTGKISVINLVEVKS